jgi:hypothetical protein
MLHIGMVIVLRVLVRCSASSLLLLYGKGCKASFSKNCTLQAGSG